MAKPHSDKNQESNNDSTGYWLLRRPRNTTKSSLTPLYVEQLEKYDKEQVVEWEKALMEVARIKGRELKKDMGFVKFNKQFTVEILLKLGGKQKFTTYQFVEMTEQTEAAMDLLDIQSADVLSRGLYGMGGIGKTTLAKTIFNRISDSFDACSFLA